jgi:predicted dehydrogenase
MLENRELDVIHVLLPPELHVPLAIECLSAGRHVFVEKPLGLGIEDCQALRRAAENAGRVVGVNHNVVFSSVMLELLAVLRSGRIGRIEHVAIAQTRPASQISGFPSSHFMFDKPGNMVFEFGPHPLSVLRVLLGRAKRVSSMTSGDKQNRDGARYFTSWQSSMVCERGTAQCLFTFGRGCRHFSVHVYGEDGVISADFVTNRLQIHESGPHRRPETAEAVDALKNARLALATVARHMRDQVFGYLHLAPNRSDMATSIASFYDALTRGEAPPEGLDEGTDVVAMCEQIVGDRTTARITPRLGDGEAHVAIG